MNLREIYALVGADYDDLLKRLPKEDRLPKYFRKYVETDEIDKMVSAYEAKDYRAVFDYSHNLKGMAANLSLTLNFSTLSQICEAVRNGDPVSDISDLIYKAQSEHQKLVKIIEQLD